MSAILVESIIRLWTGLYTKGLPPELGAERRAEVESDLWEHGSLWRERGLPGLTMQRFGRWLLGIPADLSWRLEQIGSRKERPEKVERAIKLPTTMVQRGIFGFIILLAGFFIVMGPVVLIGGGGDGWVERALWGITPIVAGSMILTGLYIINQSPRLGAGLLSGGAIIMALAWFWLFFIGIPVVIFMIWYGVSRARRVGSDRPPPGAAA
jgi:hypothetical protein